MILYIWLMIGIFVFIRGVVITKKINHFIDNSHLIEGKVVELKRRRITSDSVQTFIPIIEYVDIKDGINKTFEADVGLPEGKYLIGDKVEVWYSSESNETNVMVNHWLAKWNGLVVSMFGVLIIFSCGFWYYLN